MIYGASYKTGIFKLRLNGQGIEPIGDHAGASISGFEISADKRKLYYSLSERGSRGSIWLYDIESGRELNLRAMAKPMGPWASIEISPDSDKVAWVGRPGEGSEVGVLNLQTGKTQLYEIPVAKPDDETLLFGLAWSRDGQNVLIGRRWKLSEDFWSVEADTGTWEQISGVRVGEDWRRSVHYLKDGVDIGNDCIGCGRPGGDRRIDLSDGVAARLVENKFVIERPGAKPLEFASAQPVPPPPPEKIEVSPDGLTVTVWSSPTCIVSQRMLLGQFENRYIVYVHDGAYWLYGLDEDRKVELLDDPGLFLTW